MVRASSIARKGVFRRLAGLVFPHDRAGTARITDSVREGSSGDGGRVLDRRGQIERVAASSLEQKLRRARKVDTTGRSAGEIAHDFNNVLGVIAGYARLLADDLPDEESRHDTRAILDATKRGQELVEQLLTFCRPSPSGSEVTDRERTGNDSYRLASSHRHGPE